MDAESAPHTPEWRPASDQLAALPSAATSSILHPQQPSPLGAASSSSIDYPELDAIQNIDIVRTGRDIAPWEPSICTRLTEQIRAFSTAHAALSPGYDSANHVHSLDQALKEAAITIRFNAKWFAEAPLATLLQTALDAAAASSSSVDVFAAVTLIDIVGTYSLLPPQALLPVTRFMAQAYYNTTRANKTKKLADAVWETLQRMLESHLDGQAMAALLQVVDCSDVGYLESKIGYARIAGALMIIAHKILLRTDVRQAVPTVDLTQLLDSLWGVAVNGVHNLRELIMDIIEVILTDSHAIQELDEQMSWNTLLEIVVPCIMLTPDSKAAAIVAERLGKLESHFEPRQHPIIAQLLVDIDLPLPAPFSKALLDPWSKLNPPREWMRGVEDLLKKLTCSDRYLNELRQLAETSIAVFSQTSERLPVSEFANCFAMCIVRSETTREAAAVMAKTLVQMFTHCVSSKFPAPDIDVLFDAICGVADTSLDAATFLFQIRADVEGTLHLETVHTLYNIPSVPLEQWDRAILKVLESCDDWDIYFCFLSRLPSLLGNHPMFERRIDFVKRLRKLLCNLLDSGNYNEPPKYAGLTKSNITMHLIRILTAVTSYHRQLSKQELLGMVSIFLEIAGSRDYTVSIPCVHALTICCYELPDLMGSYMDDVIDKMSKIVTQRYLAIHVLLFLAGLSRLPDLFKNFQTHDYKKIFGVCGSYLQSVRGTNALDERQQTSSSDRSSLGSAETADALPQYVYALTHHVISFWYLALQPDHRNGLKAYITSCLKHVTNDGREHIEDQGLVTIDLMDRVDSEEASIPRSVGFGDIDGRTVTRHRLVGLLLITTETALRTGKTVVTVRRSTGTATHTIEGLTKDHDAIPSIAATTNDSSNGDYLPVFPADRTGRTYGRVYIPNRESFLGSPNVVTLPEDDDAVTRAFNAIDRTPALDSHKAGVIYIGEGQATEDEILRNVQGSPDYVEFVEALGTLRVLKDAAFNTQGLDRIDDADGQHTVVWNNKVTEVVFHVTSLMPNNEDVSMNTANKKKHVGNDWVNIVFNNSGAPFDFNTFPSQFNSVYIVITPSARTSFLQTRLLQSTEASIDSISTSSSKRNLDQENHGRFYKVQVLTRPGYPAISSAAEEKVICGVSLPGYVRNLALNECVFSLMWGHRDAEASEYPSSWRSRLEQLRRVRERYG